MAILAECRAYRKKQAGKKSGVFLRRGLTTRADFWMIQSKTTKRLFILFEKRKCSYW